MYTPYIVDVEIQDARSLPGMAQEDLRKKAVQAVLSGMRQAEVAGVFGVSRYSVIKWVAAYRKGGEAALAAHRRGHQKGQGAALTESQAARIVRWIRGRCPEQLKLPFVLWTREAVQELILQKLGKRLALTTVGKYLRSWGFTPQKPVRRAYEKSPAAVQKWLNETYPAIRARAKEEGAEIYWGDEMGLRSDHQTGTSYSPKGKTPVIPGTGQRFSTNMISAVTNRGHLCFMVFGDSFRVKVFLAFLGRLIKQAKRKVFVIVDAHPVHRAKLVQAWRARHTHELELFYLPSYSPELNPDELLNNDVKGNALGRRRPTNKGEMVADVRSYLRSTQRRPDIVRNYFTAEHVRYAA
jgi:transposase